MLVITIEVWPFGNHEKREVLATAVVANDMTGSGFSGSYDVALKRESADEPAVLTGRVEHFRRDFGAVALVIEALKAARHLAISPARVALDRVLALQQAERIVEPDAERIEIARCPYCGQMAPENQIEKPADYCHHDVWVTGKNGQG